MFIDCSLQDIAPVRSEATQPSSTGLHAKGDTGLGGRLGGGMLWRSVLLHEQLACIRDVDLSQIVGRLAVRASVLVGEQAALFADGDGEDVR